MKSTLAIAALFVSTSVLASEVDLNGFEEHTFVSSKSRAQVVAEFEQARAAGQLLAVEEIGLKPESWKSSKTRAQVTAETLEAAHLGLLANIGDDGPKPATAEQERQIALAGLRALEETAATE